MLSDDIIKFISDFSGVKCQKITINTTLLGDLGIDGEDAEDLMLEYSKNLVLIYRNLHLTDILIMNFQIQFLTYLKNQI